MANDPDTPPKRPRSKRPPATTPTGRENQLIGLANDLAEQQLRDGTASAQVMTHFLRLGSTRESLEQERIAQEVQMLKAKEKSLISGEKMEALMEGAIEAMRGYSGQRPLDAHDD